MTKSRQELKEYCGWGNKLYNGNKYFYEGMSSGTNVLKSTLDAWTPEHTNTNVPRAVYADYNGNTKESAYFLRAYYHMKLLLNWEQIIIRDRYLVTVSADELGEPISTREAAWDFIISDLVKAQKLPATLKPEQLGRATAGAANAYLGFAYLTRAYETPAKKADYLKEALAAFNEVKGYSLEREFLNMFNGKNQNSKESVFELQCTMNSADGANYKTQMHKWLASSELGGWDEILPSNLLVSEFKKERTRTPRTGYSAHQRGQRRSWQHAGYDRN